MNSNLPILPKESQSSQFPALTDANPIQQDQSGKITVLDSLKNEIERNVIWYRTESCLLMNVIKEIWFLFYKIACCSTEKGKLELHVFKELLAQPSPKIAAVAAQNLPAAYVKEAPKFSEVTQKEVFNLQPQIQNVNKKAMQIEALPVDKIPTRKITIQNCTYYCSNIIKIDAGHTGIVALVQLENGEVYPRLFYHSNSQGTWRVMPFACKDKSSGQDVLTYYGKAKNETFTQLPNDLICAFNDLESPKTTSKPLSGSVKSHIKTGDNREFDDKNFIAELAIEKDDDVLDSLTESDEKHEKDIKGIVAKTQKDHTHFKLDVIAEDDAPDFTNLSSTLAHKSIPEYGNVKVYKFLSKNKAIEYMFYEGDDGRVFLAATDKIGSKINSYGVREKPFNPQGMDAPLLEYECKISEANMPNDKSTPYITRSYLSNWKFIKKFEIIQKFFSEFKKSPLPPDK